MNNIQAINWTTFKNQLLQHPNLELQFQYAQDKLIDTSYHITEIKQAPITSVDCGGMMNAWTEIVIQLWVPENEQQEQSMKVDKALSIIEVVEKMLPLNPNGIVKIEFGNAEFDTRQMFPNKIIVIGNTLTVDLRPDSVQCKAVERGGSCGVNNDGEECCTVIPPAKSKLPLSNLATIQTCEPGSGCC
ncbi:DUF6428 family protein [Mucilaginibacter sp.]|uniref:DUF6428 family protein n=1 Tax=Mucilaginibacter sp. TaxID=1882438 RepID=UPI0035BBF8CC